MPSFQQNKTNQVDTNNEQPPLSSLSRYTRPFPVHSQTNQPESTITPNTPLQAKSITGNHVPQGVIQRNGDDDPFASLLQGTVLGQMEQQRQQQEQQRQQQLEQQRLQREQEQEQRRLQAREDDKEKLKKMFDVKDDHAGILKPNQIDTGTFDEISGLYSDIREGKTSFKFDESTNLGLPQSLNFKKNTMEDIAKILQTGSGRTLIKDLAQGDKPVTIGQSVNKLAAHQMPLPDPKSLNDLFQNKPDTYANTSNSVGTGSTVRYSPGEKEYILRGIMSTPDTVLYHELTHARHAAKGQTKTGTLSALDTGLGLGHKDIGVNKEEYATVGLGDYENDAITENEYRKEQRKLHGSILGPMLYPKRESYNDI